MDADAGVESAGTKRRLLPPGAAMSGLRAGFADAVATVLERRRGFLMVPFALMAGLLVYRVVPAEPDHATVLLLPLLALLWLGLRLRQGRTVHLAQLVFGLTLGFALLPIHGLIFGTSMLAGTVYGTYQAQVDEVLSEDSGELRVIISRITPVKGRDPGIRRARLFVRNGPDLAPGAVIETGIRFAPVPGPVVPGGYDAQFQSYFDGIGAYGTATGTLEILRVDGAGLARLVDAVRSGIGARIDRVLTGRADAVARALTIGDQSRIADETRDMMAIAGIAHVLAISGLHLTLVAGGAFAALRFGLAGAPGLSQRVEIKKIAAALGVLVTLFYLAISGASVSATRASVMLILVFGAILAGRRALTMRNVALAALFVLVSAPAGLFRPGFQLSFAAVAGLIGVYEDVRQRDLPRDAGWLRRVGRFFSGLVVTSLIAGLATALFAAYHFQQTAPLGILGNLFAIPLLGFLVLPSLTLGVLVMPLGMEAPLLQLAGWGIEQILDLAAYVAAWSSVIAYRPLLSPSVLLIGLCAIAWFVFFSGWLRHAGPVLALLLVVAFGPVPPPDLLIADRTQAVALRDGNGYVLLGGRVNSFATDVWQDTYGLPVSQDGPAVACDSLGCIGTAANGPRVAVVRDFAAFIEDCDAVDLVVTRDDAPDWCRLSTEVIDGDALRSGGVVAGFWHAEDKAFSLDQAMTDPHRPWRSTLASAK